LSAVVLPRLEITRWLAIACLPFELTCCSVTNVCKMDNFPPARRPHKSPAHTVKDLRNRPQRRVPTLRTRSARGSRTSYRRSEERQHPMKKNFRGFRCDSMDRFSESRRCGDVAAAPIPRAAHYARSQESCNDFSRSFLMMATPLTQRPIAPARNSACRSRARLRNRA